MTDFTQEKEFAQWLECKFSEYLEGEIYFINKNKKAAWCLLARELLKSHFLKDEVNDK